MIALIVLTVILAAALLSLCVLMAFAEKDADDQ
jgi:hypothetical protein